MEVAFIAPKRLARYSVYGDYFFLLPETVTEWYQCQTRFKMLDNGAYENKTLEINELLALADKVHADEIVVPDVMGDADETLRNARKYVRVISAMGYRTAVVPQGANIEEFLTCYKMMLQLPDINTICFPKWLGKDRPTVIRYLESQRLLKYKLDYHLFGLDFAEELYCYKKLMIRSVDTSMPFTNAYHNVRTKLFSASVLPRVPFDVKEFSAEQLDLLEENCKMIRDVAKRI